MNFTEQFVAMTVATLKADGKVATEEKAAIKILAEGLELDAAEVDKLIESEVNKNEDVVSLAKQVADADKAVIMEACTIVALADEVLTIKEAELLMTIANAMGMNPASVMMTVATVTQNNRSIRIEGNENAYELGDEILLD